MDTQKMLMSVAKTAIGWAVGLWLYKSFLSSSSSSSANAPASTVTPPSPPAFSADGYDD